VEFRHDSWLCPEVYRMLDRRRAAICLHDLAGSGAAEEPNNASFVYVRRHDPKGERYRGSYSPGTLRRDARNVRHWIQEGRTVFVYFNHDIGGHAVHSARLLKTMLSD
jgi:uncharacterized protein YecE (DUF72 family)